MMHRNKQKGISTVVAGIFMVAIIIVGLNAMTWGLNLQNNFGQVLTEKNLSEVERINEKIEIRDVRIDSNKFNMTVVNTGTVPVKLVKMWVTNNTCTTTTCTTANWHQNYTLTNKLVNQGDSLTNLGTELALVAKNSSSYKINLVTERGSSANFQILSPKDKAIKMSLFALPSSIPTGQNVTILLGVTNNLTDGSIVQSVRPKLPLNWTAIEDSIGATTATATFMEGPTPTVEPALTLGETVFFKWVYKITGDKEDIINFNATLVDAKKGNYIRESIQLVEDAFSTQSGVSLQSLGIAVSAADTSGTQHFHNELAPNPSTWYRMEAVLPDTTSANSFTFENSNPGPRYWITNNATTNIDIVQGKWNFTIYGERVGATPPNAMIRIMVNETDKNGFIRTGAPGTGALEAWSLVRDVTVDSGTGSQIPPASDPDVPAMTIEAQNRLLITVQWKSAGKFKMSWDNAGKDSLFKTPKATPQIPTYLVYNTNDVELYIRNTGPATIWIDLTSRVVFKKVTTGELYAGIIRKWVNTTDNTQDVISPTADSAKLPRDTLLKFHFYEPKTIPGNPGGGQSVKANPGNYDVYVRTSGYDEGGSYVVRVVAVGVVVV